MTHCERCGLSIQGDQTHSTAEDCVRQLAAQLAAMAVMARKQAAYSAQLERRIERAQIQARTAEQGRRTALKNLTRERERTRALDQVRTSLHSAWRQAAAEAQTERSRVTRLLAQLRRIAGVSQQDAA